MDENAKVLIDVLQKELARARAKALATDDWFYRLLSVGIVPFLIFLGYCAANESYRLMLAAIPPITITGLLVVAILRNHYLFAGYYVDYLERRINILAQDEFLREAEFGRIFYGGPLSLVSLGYLLAVLVLLVINIFAFPVIDSIIRTVNAETLKTLGRSAWFLNHFWALNVSYLATVGVVVVGAFLYSNLQARRLVNQLKKKEPKSGRQDTALKR